MMQKNRFTQCHLFHFTLLIFFTSTMAMAAVQSDIKNSSKMESLMMELTGKDFSKESEEALYAGLVESYQQNDGFSFRGRLQQLQKKYSQGVYIDNALFLAGQKALDQKNYAQALKYFAEILDKHKNSNKAVSALWAQAYTYKRMNLPDFAAKKFKQVMNQYPGSPESFRAEAELRLIK